MEANASKRTLLVRCLIVNGDLLVNENRLTEALHLFRDACEIQEEAVGAEPESVYHRSTLASVLASRGRAAQASGARDEARQSYARAAELSATMGAQFPSQRYSQACYIALLIPLSPPAARDSLGFEAISALRLAIEGGYDNRDAMDRDADLESLRGREDFRKLMASID